jgi:hypothetical protein
MQWAEREDNHDELIVLTFQKCADPSLANENDVECRSLTYDAAIETGFHDDQIIFDCRTFSDVTVGQALENGRKHFSSNNTGGIIVALGSDFQGCSGNSYEPTTTCYIDDHDCTDTPENAIPSQHFDVAAPLPLFSTPGQRLYNHIIGVTDSAIGFSGSTAPLIGVSAHFQYTLASILKGIGSSIVKDEAAFNTNARVACWIRDGYLSNINLVLVDNVCNSGPYIRHELLKYKEVEGLSDRIEIGHSLQCEPVRVLAPKSNADRGAPTPRPTTGTATGRSCTALTVNLVLFCVVVQQVLLQPF